MIGAKELSLYTFPMQDAFSIIYKSNTWGFGSGLGSLPRWTRPYQQFLQMFMRENNIKTVVDVGCGDWQFSRLIDWSAVDYLGLDVVPEVIKKNRSRYAAPNVRFELAPERFADISSADLLLVKDVLQHFPTDAVHRFVKEVLGRFRFALVTNCIEPASHRNREIEVGGFRPLDLREAPFNYPAPVVFSFSGPAKRSLRTMRKFPAWHKVVLLYSR